jgi:hypothetical protein
VVGILIASVIALVLVLSIGPLARDVRKLHRSGKSLSDSAGAANGVSAGGMTFIGSQGTH